MTMTTLDKALIAIGVSVAAGCRPCTTFHLGEARKAGATTSDIERAVAAALCVRASAAEEMRCHALELEPPRQGCGCTSKDRWEELVALGAALAVNCTHNIEKHLAAARQTGALQEDLDQVFATAHYIRARAIGHGETLYKGPTATSPGEAGGCASASASCC